MARGQRTSIPAELRSLFLTRWLNAAARESGLVTRRRKVAPAHLFSTLVLGFAVGHRRSLASLRRFFQTSTGVALVPSPFYDRFTAGTVRFLRRALVRAAKRLGPPSGELQGHLARFKDLLVALVEAGRRVSERRVTYALAVIASELAVVLAGVPASPESAAPR
jgi:putative transposase